MDWTTTDGCARCNEHGPYFPGGTFYVGDEAARDAHQAWHGFVAALTKAAHIPQLLDWLTRRLA